MESDNTVQTLLIGTGGLNPGLGMMAPDARSAESILSLPSGHSVYALDVDPEGERFAIGDRAGNIQVYSWPGMSSDSVPEKLFHFTQGAPLLSVCLAGDSILASSDTQGRCLLWDAIENEDHPVSLEGDEVAICSMLRIGEDRIAGLSAKGSFLIWDIHRKILLESLTGPKPPQRLGFVKLVHWPAQDAVVYPTEEGFLAIVTLSSLGLQIKEAHLGPIYACIVNGKELHTLGMKDGYMKTWTCNSESCELEQIRSAPRGVLSGELLDGMSEDFLLINGEGEAAIYGLESDSLHCIRRLEGNHFRIAAGPAASARLAMEKRRCFALCQDLVNEAHDRIDAHETEGLEDLYGHITQLGFESVAVGLRIHQSYEQEDIIEELRARHRLIEIMPELNPDSLHRYACLLAMTWCIPEAKKIFDQIQTGNSADSEWLEKVVRAFAGKTSVLEPDYPIPLLIEAANIVDRPFNGRWVMDYGPSIPFPDDGLDIDALVNQIEQVTMADHIEDLPHADAQSTWWITGESVRKANVVVFTDPSNGNITGPRWAIRIVKDEMRCNLIPMVLFDTGSIPNTRSARDHNRTVLSAFEQTADRIEPQSWPPKLKRVVEYSIRCLRTRLRSRRKLKGR